MKVYITGPISKGGTLSTDEIKVNVARFTCALQKLTRQGYECWSPPHHAPSIADPSTTYEQWVTYMRIDIKALVDCDAIYKLPGWEDSRGARLEVHIARELGLKEL